MQCLAFSGTFGSFPFTDRVQEASSNYEERWHLTSCVWNWDLLGPSQLEYCELLWSRQYLRHPHPPTPTRSQSRASRPLVGRVSRTGSAVMTYLSAVTLAWWGTQRGHQACRKWPKVLGMCEVLEVAQAPHGPRWGRKCSVSRSVMLDSLRPMDCIAHQASLSMEFSRQEYCSWLLFPPGGGVEVKK